MTFRPGRYQHEKIHEVGKAATSATTLEANNLTRYIWRYGAATVRYIIVITLRPGKMWSFRRRLRHHKNRRCFISLPAFGLL